MSVICCASIVLRDEVNGGCVFWFSPAKRARFHKQELPEISQELPELLSYKIYKISLTCEQEVLKQELPVINLELSEIKFSDIVGKIIPRFARLRADFQDLTKQTKRRFPRFLGFRSRSEQVFINRNYQKSARNYQKY